MSIHNIAPSLRFLKSHMIRSMCRAMGRDFDIDADEDVTIDEFLARGGRLAMRSASAYADAGEAERAFEMFDELRSEGWTPKGRVDPTLMPAAARPLAVTTGPDAHAGLWGSMSSQPLLRPVALALDVTPAPPVEPSRYERHFKNWIETHKESRAFSAAATGTTLDISILDTIGSSMWTGDGVTSKAVQRALAANPDAKTVRVLIDSPGGDVFEGVAIQNLLKMSGKTITVDIIGEASSAASVVAMAGHTITMHEGAMMMVHRGSAGVRGYASDLRALATVLDQITAGIAEIYATRTKKSRADIDAMLLAETWMTASDAVAMGFADSLAPKNAA